MLWSTRAKDILWDLALPHPNGPRLTIFPWMQDLKVAYPQPLTSCLHYHICLSLSLLTVQVLPSRLEVLRTTRASSWISHYFHWEVSTGSLLVQLPLACFVHTLRISLLLCFLDLQLKEWLIYQWGFHVAQVSDSSNLHWSYLIREGPYIYSLIKLLKTTLTLNDW